MSKRVRSSVRPSTRTRTTAVVVPDAAAAVVVPDAAAVVDVVPAAVVDVPAVPAVPELPPVITLAAAGANVPDAFIMPPYMAAWIAGFRAIARMPSTTVDERRACVAAFAAAAVAVAGDVPMPVGRHTGRFSTMPVFESQNTLYVAAALANCGVNGGHIMAAWRVELPNAKCDYLVKNYAWSTMSEFLNGKHNGSAIPDGGIVVRAWANRNRAPIA